MKKSTIGALATGAYHPVYSRRDGKHWMKMNATFHAPVKKEGEEWVIDGNAEQLDPKEEVEVLHEASEQVA